MVATNKLIGVALDWAVAKCLGLTVKIPAFADKPWLLIVDCHGQDHHCPSWSTDWSHCGPIIFQEKIGISDWPAPNWRASFTIPRKHPTDDRRDPSWHSMDGPTPQIAAMRCFVSSKLGDEVEIPKELQ